ncbi:MAG: NAD(P)H-hydrate dehydratase [Candidatus Kapabacteria bacterium]|nr:NAD(P)H-hydrate dehydratase [Candidatus Kapabacteria bacterium]
MQIILSSEQSKNMDSYLINHLGISSSILMETAAIQSANKILDLNKEFKSVLILCGIGNNGGDGFALARILSNKTKVKVLWIGSESKMSKETHANFNLISKFEIDKIHLEKIEDLKDNIFELDCIIDCLIGIGGDENLKGLVVDVLKMANSSHSYKIAIDVPTGYNSNNGKIHQDYFKCDILITMYSIKLGFLFDKELYSKTSICDLNINKSIIEEFSQIYSLEQDDIRNLPGAGMVYLFTYSRHSALLPEIICHNLDTAIVGNSNLEKSIAIGIGPGLGKQKNTLDNTRQIIEKYKDSKSFVIDADGLYSLPNELNHNVILTPHLYEFSKISGLSVEEIENDRIGTAISYAKKMNCVLLLKGATTIITNGSETYLNTSGNPGMSTAGSGDVLTGIILALLSQGLKPFLAASLAVFIHGRAGDIYTNKYNQETLTASKIIDYLKYAI